MRSSTLQVHWMALNSDYYEVRVCKDPFQHEIWKMRDKVNKMKAGSNHVIWQIDTNAQNAMTLVEFIQGGNVQLIASISQNK